MKTKKLCACGIGPDIHNHDGVPKERVGSWESNPVTDDEINKFWSRIQKLADVEFGVDDEGDSSVEVIVVNRTQYERMSYIPVMYAHRDKKSAEQAKHAAILNHKIAADTLHLQLDLERMKGDSK